MADLNACRICLVHENNEKLLRIYENGGKLANEIFQISGIKIMEFSAYDVPALICESCLADLKNAIKFRNRAKASDRSFFRQPSYEVETLNWQDDLTEINTYGTIEAPPNDGENNFIKEEFVEEYLESENEGVIVEDTVIEEVPEKSVDVIVEKLPSKIFQCEICFLVLSTKKSLDYHLKVKHEFNVTEKYVCELCQKQFSIQKALIRHMAQTHSIEQATAECSECQKTFSSSRMLSIHMNKEHDPDAPGEFPCEHCGKTLQTRRKWKKHVSEVHVRKSKRLFESIVEEQHPCPLCGKFFKSRGQLTAHEKTHIVLKPSDYFYCDLCGNKFKSKSLILQHIRLRHVAKIRYACPDCPGRNWATKHALNMHIKVFHQGIRDFRCEWCGKGFGAKDKLTAHIRIHTGEQPFQCQFCEKKYTHQTDYIRHTWSHTGKRRYTCKFCKQGYIKKAQLDSHRCPWKN